AAITARTTNALPQTSAGRDGRAPRGRGRAPGAAANVRGAGASSLAGPAACVFAARATGAAARNSNVVPHAGQRNDPAAATAAVGKTWRQLGFGQGRCWLMIPAQSTER